ncbi:MAG: methyltransferase [Nitrospirae bacterium]|nr:methyltransferase [Nitrospirota bacterium]
MPEITPDRLMMMAGAFQNSKILMVANELGIFKYIGDKSRTPADVAKALMLDTEATGMLMTALVGLGLLTMKAGRYANSPESAKYLASDDPEQSLSCIIRHMNHMYDGWAGLDSIVKKGRPKKRQPSKILHDRKHNRDFICGMFEIGYGSAKKLAEVIDLTGVRKVADIGGGPAQYPIVFAEKAPDATFVVADYPNTVKVAREYIKKYGMSKRIKAVDCAFFDVAELGIGDDYDLALLSQVLHAASDEKAKGLLKKTYDILKPGGRIVVNENAMDDDRMGPTPPMVFAVNMLVGTEGRVYTPKELSAWLREAGFKGIKARRVHERSVVVEAVK